MTSDLRKYPCDPPDLPDDLAQRLAGYRWARDTIGQSGGAVYRLHGKPGASDLYLKCGSGTVADDIADEMTRLRWLAGHLPVPQLHHGAMAPGEAWLLTAALPGRTVYDLLLNDAADASASVDAVALFLRRLHAVPVSACPFVNDHRRRLMQARCRIDAGLIEEERFDAARQGWTAEQVWAAMQPILPSGTDAVVTHGDFSLDNILIADGVVTGCIDLGRVGLADRYQDIAIAWNSLAEFSPAMQARFLATYGIADPDRDRLDFHLMLDELF